MVQKLTYYVNLHSKKISQGETGETHRLTIYATQEEVTLLRKLFNKIESNDFLTFFRAHVPIKPYHNAESNDEVDESYKEAAKMLYYLGDDETKQFIRDSGIIGSRPIKTDYTYPDPEHDGGRQA